MHYMLNLIVKGEGKSRFATPAQEGAWPDCMQPLLTNVHQGEFGLYQTMDLVISKGYSA